MRESVYYPPNGCGVKERHGGMENCGQHVAVNDRRSTHESHAHYQRCGKNEHTCNDTRNKKLIIKRYQSENNLYIKQTILHPVCLLSYWLGYIIYNDDQMYIDKCNI